VAYEKPLPRPDADTEPFWQGCRQHLLRFQKCGMCGHVRWPPSLICPVCYSEKAEWITASGKGKVHTFAIFHQAYHEAFVEKAREIWSDLVEQDELAEDDITEDDEAFSSKVPEDMRDFFKKANDFYFEGRRELRMENYVRALESFRKAVTFYPRHQRANYYIKFLNEKLMEESKRHLNIGKKMLEQKRYDDAIRSFNEVMNLNLKEQGSVFFKEAERLRGIAEKRKQVVIE